MLEVPCSRTNLHIFAGLNELYPKVVGGNGQLRADWQNWDKLGPLSFNPSVSTCSLFISGLVAKMGAEVEEMETCNHGNGTVGVQKQAYPACKSSLSIHVVGGFHLYYAGVPKSG